ncbi:MAG: hypothetical protein LBQ55_01970 [Treponema sp.]|nr:hypothetical protein [Treponema sp.]
MYIIDTGSNAKVRNSDANTSVKLYAKWENGSWTYDGSGVAGIGEDTESEWLAPPPPGPPPSP